MLAAGRRLSQARRARAAVPSQRGAPLTPASQRPAALFSLGRAQPGSAIAVRPCRRSTCAQRLFRLFGAHFPQSSTEGPESDQARRVETRSGSMRSTPSAYPAHTAEPGWRRHAGASQTRHFRRKRNQHHHYRPAQAPDRKPHRTAKHPPARHGGARQGTTWGCLFVAFFTLPA